VLTLWCCRFLPCEATTGISLLCGEEIENNFLIGFSPRVVLVSQFSHFFLSASIAIFAASTTTLSDKYYSTIDYSSTMQQSLGKSVVALNLADTADPSEEKDWKIMNFQKPEVLAFGWGEVGRGEA
jgi:hypothetical protein